MSGPLWDRRMALLLSSCLLLPGLLLPRVAAAAAATPLPPPPVSHGVLEVPENRSRPDGARVQLAYVRVQRGPAPSRNAHVLLAGGPGDSGVDQVLQLVQRGGPQVRALFDGDLIGIDQRGSGRSVPGLDTQAGYDLPLEAPASIDAWLPRMRQAAGQAAAALAEQGIDLAAYNTVESADDVDAVRAALGYERLTLWGRSYGSHLALATLRRHPQRVTRMVLVAPEGPDDTWKLPSQADEVLARLGRRAGEADLPGRMRAVIRALDAQPVEVEVVDPVTRAPVRITLGAFDVQWVTAQALGDPRALAMLPAAYARMSGGDYSAFAAVALAHRRRAAVGPALGHIADLSSGASPGRRQRIATEARDAVLGDAMNFPGMYLGPAWGSPDLGEAFRRPVASAVPALILVGDLDARTPVANGERIAAHLPNAQVVVVENAAHQFNVFGDAQIVQMLEQFLTDGRVDRSRIVLPPLPFAGAGPAR